MLMAEQRDLSLQCGAPAPVVGLDSAAPAKPAEPFLNAAQTNWGVASGSTKTWIISYGGIGPSRRRALSEPGLDSRAIIRGAVECRPARAMAPLLPPHHPWASLSYHLATNQVKNYFHTRSSSSATNQDAHPGAARRTSSAHPTLGGPMKRLGALTQRDRLF